MIRFSPGPQSGLLAPSKVDVPAEEMFSLVVVQADGTEHPLTADQFRFANPPFSPDGRHVLVAARRRPNEQADLWMHDVQTNAATRLATDRRRLPAESCPEPR